MIGEARQSARRARVLLALTAVQLEAALKSEHVYAPQGHVEMRMWCSSMRRCLACLVTAMR